MLLSLRKSAGWLAVIVLAFFPVIRWAIISPLSYRFLNLAETMTSFGQIAGLLGMSLFSVNLILSSRLKFLDKYFYGLDKVYNQHHIIGAISFCLLLFHPLFLVVQYAQFSLRSAALFFLPLSSQAVNFGIYSLFLMIVLMIFTFYIKLKYQQWKFFHKFMVVTFMFSVVHVFFVSSDISRDNILRIYVLGLAVIGLVAGFWRAFLIKKINNNFEYEIVRVAMLKPDVVEIEMAPKGKAMEFEAGQFVFMSFSSKAVEPEAHPFSISSAPEENNLRVTVKALGDFTGEMKNLKIGDKVSVEGPFGKFSYQEVSDKNQIWIAGGVGITPFLSMAKSLKGNNYKIDLYYSVKSKEEIIAKEELEDIALSRKNFRVIFWCVDEKGYLSASEISKISGDLENKDIFLCGPPAFMESLRGQFINLKADKDRIHWEKFNFK